MNGDIGQCLDNLTGKNVELSLMWIRHFRVLGGVIYAYVQNSIWKKNMLLIIIIKEYFKWVAIIIQLHEFYLSGISSVSIQKES